ncbi:MAG: HAMP domain-containing histidine kinase [Bacteroidia bacterium]|nr:HAMP domain-containing histidine kinase [Bacteroidia bacterium]
MTIQVKFAVYNAVSKALIILAFMALLPLLVERIVYDHIDKRLVARSERVLLTVRKGSIADIVREQDCSFESYNILKEEFVAIYPITDPGRLTAGPQIRNESWSIEGENLQHRIIKRPFLYDNQMYELNIGEGISAIDDLKSIIQRFMLVMMLAVILISLFVDLGFVRLLIKPLNKIISSKLQPVPSPTSFNFTPVESSTTEFNQLDARINEMMHKLKDTFLIEKEFISNVSHELQTPISIIQNRLENIMIESNVSDEVMIKLSESQRTLNRMSRIIKALLLISKIENDQYLKQEKVRINELLDEVIEEVEERINERGLKLYKHFYDDFNYGPCNKTLLFTMIMNLVNNAIKYNRDGGSIMITSRIIQGKFQVEIKDTGIGMEKTELPSIFDRFKRLNKSKADGYGLGLPIVKTIAGFHHIDVQVDSEPETGTVFTLVF